MLSATSRGDGADDVVIGAENGDDYYGAAYLVNGPTTGSIELSSAVLFGKSGEMYGRLGYSVGTIGDWSGDDGDEVVIGGIGMSYEGNSYAGRTWVVSSDDL